MSAHRAPRSASPTRRRSRAAIGGAAMTTLFLTGGAGVAFAGESGGDEDRKGGNSLSLLSGNRILNDNLNGNEVEVDVLNDLLGGKDQDKGKDDGKTKDQDKHEDKDKDKHENGDEHEPAGHHDDCGCPPEKKHEDCPEKKKTDDVTSDKKDEDDTEDVTSDDTDDVTSDSDDEDSDATIVPVGSADTGDGSLLGPLPAPAIAPVASSWSMADTMATGGGIAAAALLASAGVGMARHRREGAHRA